MSHGQRGARRPRAAHLEKRLVKKRMGSPSVG
jgi:hypothetical protein